MKIQSYRLKKKRCKKDKNKSELFLFSPLMTPSSTFSQAKQKKSNTKTKTKVDVKGKKQKVFLSFPTIIPSSTFSERLLIFVFHHWSMIEMHSQAEAYTLHYSTLSPLCPILFFYYIFYIAPPLFLHFHSFLLCTLLFFNVCPSFLHLCLASYSFYTASYFLYILPCVFVCVFLHCALYLSIVSPITGCKFFESLKNKNVDPGNVES